MTDVDTIRARWAAVQVGDWTRWTAADLTRVCRQSTATLTAVLHAPDDVRTLLHELRVVRVHRDWLTDHVNVWRANAEQAYRMVDALTVERDAARALACDLVSQQLGPADDARWAELAGAEIRATRDLGAEIREAAS